jgi:predicted phosphoribosyltransferase
LKKDKNYFMFRDRIEAGVLLAAKLKKYKNDPGIVMAVPRGGVPVAYAVAKEFGFPIEVILTKKIGHPFSKEYAIGAASLTDYFIIPHENVTEDYIQYELKRIRSRLKEMYTRFMGDKEPESLKGKTVIVIDDGIATGNTLMGTIHVLRKSNPGKIVIGVPVASKSAVQKLSKEVDEIIAVMIPEPFYGVGAFYEDFEQVSDDEVMFYLDQLRELRQAG